MREKKKIFKVGVEHVYDSDPDTSYIGYYTNQIRPGVIIRKLGQFYEKLPAPMERDTYGRFTGKGEPYDIPRTGREYVGFIPCAAAAKFGTKEYYKYGLEDFKRMEDFEKGNWHYIGIISYAEVGVDILGNGHFIVEKISSSGLWRIESDSDKSYFNEVEEEELSHLKNILTEYGFGKYMIKKAFLNIERIEL